MTTRRKVTFSLEMENVNPQWLKGLLRLEIADMLERYGYNPKITHIKINEEQNGKEN